MKTAPPGVARSLCSHFSFPEYLNGRENPGPALPQEQQVKKSDELTEDLGVEAPAEGSAEPATA